MIRTLNYGWVCLFTRLPSYISPWSIPQLMLLPLILPDSGEGLFPTHSITITITTTIAIVFIYFIRLSDHISCR